MSLTALWAFAWLATITPPASLSPGKMPPATQESSSPDTPSFSREGNWIGTDVAVITIRSKKPRLKIDTHEGVIFDLDFEAQGALCLANAYANLHTEPRDLTLSFDPSLGVLLAAYNKEAKALNIYLKTVGAKPLCTLPLADVPARVLLQQRNQLALYAIPPDGSCTTLVWFGTVNYLVNLKAADQYELCRDLKITMGRRELTLDTLRGGVPLDSLDQIADITVAGTSPKGEPFTHRYKFNYPDVEKVLAGVFTQFLRHLE